MTQMPPSISQVLLCLGLSLQPEDRETRVCETCVSDTFSFKWHLGQKTQMDQEYRVHRISKCTH